MPLFGLLTEIRSFTSILKSMGSRGVKLFVRAEPGKDKPF